MTKNELYHHGILGMKWGVRRYQNKDGSLTKAGQKRYSVSGSAVDSKDLDKRVQNSHTIKQAIQNWLDVDRRSESDFNNASEAFNKAAKAYVNSPKYKADMMSYLKSELGDGCDDRDLFDMTMMDWIEDHASEKVNSRIKKLPEMAAYEKSRQEFWKAQDNLKSSLMNELGETSMDNLNIVSEGRSMSSTDYIEKLINKASNGASSYHWSMWRNKDSKQDELFDSWDIIQSAPTITMDEFNRH